MKTILAAALAFTLSACGGGGTFTLPVEADPNEPSASSPSDTGGDTGDNGGDSAQRLLNLE